MPDLSFAVAASGASAEQDRSKLVVHPGTTPLATLESLALATQRNNATLANHNERVGYLAALIAQKLELSGAEVELLRHAAPLHDIGTLFIPERLLLRPGRLLPEEFEIVKSHVRIGADLLANAHNDLFRLARLIAENHHERFDGSGYPHGRRGANIPLVAQITAVADVFDSLVHAQPYRPAWPIEEALREIREGAGRQFDPGVVAAFLRVVEEQELAPSSAPKPKVLMRGKLGPVTLFDMIMSLAQNKQTCKFRVHTGYSQTLLVFSEGNLIHAAVDGVEGEQALFALALKSERQPNVKFTVEAWDGRDQNTTIHRATEQLLLKIAVGLDHKRRDRVSISDVVRPQWAKAWSDG